MFNFNHLYYFYITAKSATGTAAAEHLRISQPSLSSQLKVLESALGMRLFKKVGRRNQLSESGLLIYGFCRRMFEVSEELSELVIERVPSVARRIVVGVSEEVDSSLVAAVVSSFLKAHAPAERPKVTLISGAHAHLVEKLSFRELDLIVTNGAIVDQDVVSLVRAEVPVVLICSYKEKEVSLTKQTLQWLMPAANTKFRAEADLFLESKGVKVRVAFESASMSASLRLVLDRVGLAFALLPCVQREVQTRLIRIVGPKKGCWAHRLWLSCHDQNSNDPIIRTFSGHFKELSHSF